MHGNLWIIIAACHISKNAAIPLIFLYHILKTVPKTFDPFQSSSSPFQQVTLHHYVHACLQQKMQATLLNKRYIQQI